MNRRKALLTGIAVATIPKYTLAQDPTIDFLIGNKTEKATLLYVSLDSKDVKNYQFVQFIINGKIIATVSLQDAIKTLQDKPTPNRECPNCGTVFEYAVIPNSLPYLARCSKCNNAFWLDRRIK